jgi:type I restriction enzyme S subunit
MDAKTFLTEFETIADAPGGVAKLRELILQLAVQGKLVPQDPNDEPASVIIDQITAEKYQDIGRQKHLLLTSDELAPFDIPNSWSFAPLVELCRFIDYRGKTQKKTDLGIRLITAKNIREGFIKDDPREYVSRATYDEFMTRGFPRNGDVLFTTEAPLGNVALVEIDEEFALAQRVINLQPRSGLFGRFLMFGLLSPPLQSIIRENATGTTATGIKSARLKQVLFPVPPEPEQHHIVAKVDELMALCDQLEERQTQRNTTRKALQESALDALANAETPDELVIAWKRVRSHWDVVIAQPDCIGTLRQAILQLAVRGKLVPQDPDDEPASILLERIAEERAQKLNRQKHLPFTNDEQSPFKIPKGWSWTQLNTILETTRDISYGIIKLGPEPEEGGVPVLRCSDVRYRMIVPDGIRRVYEEISNDYLRTILRGGEILMNIRGTLGGCALVTEDYASYNVAREVAVIPIHKALHSRYILDVIASPHIQISTLSNLRGIAYKGLNLNLLRKFLIPLPPLTEQHRIVAKVDELMAICDELEVRLQAQQDMASELATASVYALAG